MREPSLNKLEYPRVIETVLSYTTTYPGRRLAEKLRPLTDRRQIEIRLKETEEARRLIAKGARPPLPSLEGMEETMQLLGTGSVLSERQLEGIARFVRSCGQLRRFMESKRSEAGAVAGYSASMHGLGELLSAIETAVDQGGIRDAASPELAKLRRRIQAADEKLRRRLDQLLGRYADCLQERLVSQRGGRYVLPVKKELRKRVPGTVLDESASGQTAFVEPAEAVGPQQELLSLRADENREELRILATLTEEAERYSRELAVNVETVGHYDLLFAKAKWALALDGSPAELNEDGVIDLRGARHPFLPGRAVPLHVAVGGDYRTLLITGPNTGGKTATIKTVGLLALMTQTGLLIPAEAGSRLPAFRAVEADIGDDQSLDRSLSTFSSHLRNVTDILAEADRRTLVLLDELATGTDPGEGIGLSIAVLEELHRRGATVLATTHFNEIKEYARTTPGYRNARMAFDEETLRPLYRLDMGEAGDSYAFVIARKLGVSAAIVDRAKAIASGLRAGRAETGGWPLADVGHGASEVGAKAAEPSRPEAMHAEHEPPLAEPSRVESPHTGSTRAGSQQAGSQRSGPPHAEPPRRERSRNEPARNEGGRRSSEEASPEPGVGDQVWIPSLNARGVVFAPADERGEMVVQVRGRKLRLNRKRVKLAIEARHLYPADYDMAIVFETVENRKKRKLMGKRHVEGLQIETPPEEP